MTTKTKTAKTETITTTYGALQNGDRVWISGYLFEVTNIRIASRKGDRATMHSEPNTDDVIRFEGRCVDAASSIAGTGYDGGTYGGYAFVPCRIEVAPRPARTVKADRTTKARRVKYLTACAEGEGGRARLCMDGREKPDTAYYFAREAARYAAELLAINAGQFVLINTTKAVR